MDTKRQSQKGAPGYDAAMAERTWRVYLAGEIHSDWRERIAAGAREAGLPAEFSAPVTDHATSDDAGVGTLGDEGTPFWRDHMGAGVNAIRTQTLIRDADVVVVRFGDKYRQWNAAFDAGFAAALGKPVVTLHDTELDHALKEVDRAAQATARTAEQVVDVLRYVIAGKLP
jgi:YtoQ family protein